MKKVGIVGLGWVGKAVNSLFPDAVIYDEPLKIGSMKEINKCDVVFICVPTPNKEDGSLDTSIVEKVIKECKCDLIVIRSTINPGDCDRWEEEAEIKGKEEGFFQRTKNICFQPEYLGETVQHPLLNEGERKFLIIGGGKRNRHKLIELYQEVYNADISIRQVTNYEAEVIKLSENRAIAFKIAQCQELYDACKSKDVDYYTIRDAVYGDDPRFNLWWTFVYSENRGFNSKCLPKDVYAWSAWAGKPQLTENLLRYNNRLIKGD